jgi:hypothetical protein
VLTHWETEAIVEEGRKRCLKQVDKDGETLGNKSQSHKQCWDFKKTKQNQQICRKGQMVREREIPRFLI